MPGRVVLDGIQLLRGAFIRMEDYALDAVARRSWARARRRSAGAAGRPREEILRLFREDRPRFVEYNRTDARLALEILEKLRLVELAVERSRLTGMPLDRVSASHRRLRLPATCRSCGGRGVVAPSGRLVVDEGEPQAGGHVLEPVAGPSPQRRRSWTSAACTRASSARSRSIP